MSQQVKDQYNKPKDSNGNFVAVLPPRGAYSQDDLLLQAYRRGWTDNFFSEPDKPNNFPYWDKYLMPEGGAEVYVSVFGEVACCFDRNVETPKYSLLEQQWNRQWMPDDKEEWKRQKYLYVYFNNSHYYNITHGGLMLHSMVGLVHSPITQDATWYDWKEGRYKLKPKVNLDHLDKDKSNNSVYNLNWTTSTQNQVMVDWSIEEKRALFADAEKLDKENRDKLLLRQ